MKEYKLIFIIIISLILPIMINGCISNDNSSNNNDNNKINAEYIVNISTNITEDYTIICPITLSLSEDPAIFSDYLEIIYGNGTFQIIKLSDKHPYYYNLSST